MFKELKCNSIIISMSLPEEIINDIKNIACHKIVNGNYKSNEILIAFGLNESAKCVHNELIQWVLKSLDKISNYSLKVYGCNFNIISQIKDDDYEDDDDGKIKNTIIVAIHIENNNYYGSSVNDELILSYDIKPEMVVSPKEIMNCFIKEPKYVSSIRVNTVKEILMRRWWTEMISTEPNLFDIAGQGFMVHPMWCKSNTQEPYEWISMREQSFGFGWIGYR